MARHKEIDRAMQTMYRLIDDNGLYGNPTFTEDTIKDFLTCIQELERSKEKEPVFVEKELWIGPEDAMVSVKACPKCRNEIVNHGKGWVCIDPNCRQRIEQ